MPFSVAWALALLSLAEPTGGVGGLSAAQAATPETQALIDPLRVSALAKAKRSGFVGDDFEFWKAISVKTQVVAGRTHFVKVQVGRDSFAHLRIFEPLPHTGLKSEVVAIELNQALDSELNAFFKSTEL